MWSFLARRRPVVVVVALAIASSAACGGSAARAGSAAPVVQHPTTPKIGEVGHDVGVISCQGTLPTGGTFGVIGATAGKPYFASPCLSDEYLWAKALADKPQYYINLADPGHKSTHWGHGGPKACHKSAQRAKYDLDCAYDYGYEAALKAYGYVTKVGSDGQGRWWLDVETDNSWGTSKAGIAANLAVIRGALRYLRGRSHTALGIYTETTWWTTITDDTSKFSGVPVWGGGADTKKHAQLNCRKHSITGGPALLAQWIIGPVDHDIAC